MISTHKTTPSGKSKKILKTERLYRAIINGCVFYNNSCKIRILCFIVTWSSGVFSGENGCDVYEYST